jgi:hypothetical protein
MLGNLHVRFGGGRMEKDAVGCPSLPTQTGPRTPTQAVPRQPPTYGDPAQLDRFVQAYAVEKARIEALKRGHSVAEQTLSDGSVVLTVTVGGAA